MSEESKILSREVVEEWAARGQRSKRCMTRAEAIAVEVDSSYSRQRFADSHEALRARVSELEAEEKRFRNRQRDGNDWAVATFGEATVESTLRRIDQELREFYKDPVGEAKDIAIFLYRLMSVAGKDLDAEVDAKMEINRKRTWVLNGEGCGQHTGSVACKGVMEELLELRAERDSLRRERDDAKTLIITQLQQITARNSQVDLLRLELKMEREKTERLTSEITAAKERARIIGESRDVWERAHKQRCADLENTQVELAAAIEAGKAAESSKRFTQDWYGSRWERMHKLFRSPAMKDTQAASDWFSVVANGETLGREDDPPISFMARVNMDRFSLSEAKKELSALRTKLESAVEAGKADKWLPIATAPKDGTVVVSHRSVRYLPYKPDGKRQMKTEGRWQEHNGYGWENCKEPPTGWMPMPEDAAMQAAQVEPK